MELFCAETLDFNDEVIMIDVPAEIDPVIVSDNRVLENMLNAEKEVNVEDYCGNKDSKLAPHMRKIVTDWMMEVCEDQQCKPEVFFLSINYLDRFLSSVNIKKNQFQLCASVCILLASKLLGTPVFVTSLIDYCDNCYSKEEILRWEVLILSKLGWNINSSNCLTIVRQFIKDYKLQELEEDTYDILVLLHMDVDFALMEQKKLSATGLAWAALNRDYEDTDELLKKLCEWGDISEYEIKETVEKVAEMIESNLENSTSEHLTLEVNKSLYENLKMEKMMCANLHNLPEIVC